MTLSGKVADLFNSIAGFADFVSGSFCSNTYSLSYVIKVEVEAEVEAEAEAEADTNLKL